MQPQVNACNHIFASIILGASNISGGRVSLRRIMEMNILKTL